MYNRFDDIVGFHELIPPLFAGNSNTRRLVILDNQFVNFSEFVDKNDIHERVIKFNPYLYYINFEPNDLLVLKLNNPTILVGARFNYAVYRDQLISLRGGSQIDGQSIATKEYFDFGKVISD